MAFKRRPMITCCIQYTLDPDKLDAFEPEAQENFADGNQSGCILVESRSFLRRVA